MEEILPSTSTDLEVEPEEISEYEPEPLEKIKKPLNMSLGAVKLRSWLNKSFKVEMTDGRVLIGIFLCTDRDANVILGSCSEYLPVDSKNKSVNEEPRMLGLVMIPGKHIISVQVDTNECEGEIRSPLNKIVDTDNVM